MKDFTLCEEKKISFIFLGEYSRLLGFLVLLRMWLSVTDLIPLGATGHTWLQSSFVLSHRSKLQMSEGIPDLMGCYLHKIIFGYLLWTGSNLKDPEVAHVDRDILNQMLRGQDQRVTLVWGVWGEHSRASPVNCPSLVPDTRVAAALHDFQQLLLESSSQTTNPGKKIAFRSS